MTEREFACIRDLVNLARLDGATKARVHRQMLEAGWTEDEIKGALAALAERS